MSPVASKSFQSQFILSLGFIAAIRNTLGATIDATISVFLGGAISTIYCICVINILPKNIYCALIATNVFIFLITYSSLPKLVCRFSILPTCHTLLQWFEASSIDTSHIIHLWVSISIGAVLAIIVLLVPLPVVPTAYRETQIRMRFIAQQLRREIIGIVLLICEYQDSNLNGDVKRKRETFQNEDIEGNKIEMLKESYGEDNPDLHSASLEGLKRNYLLASDIEDLHSIVCKELKELERALNEISLEPYFILLKLLHQIKKVLRLIPFVKKFIKKSSTLTLRLKVWTTGFLSLHRIMSSILSLDSRHRRALVGQRKLSQVRILRLLNYDFSEALMRISSG